MAKLFNVNLPDGVSSVKLDSQGRGTVQYTVKNVSSRAIDGRGVLISLPQVKPPSGPVEKGWVKVDGKTDRHFDVDKEETFAAKIAVPPKSAPGDYTFRLDAVWVDQPDQGDAGGAVRFTVPKPTNGGGGFPLWLIPVILVILVGVGVGIYLVAKPKATTVPDLKGKTIPEATSALTAVNLTLDTGDVGTVQGKPEDADHIVSQTPDAGTKAKPGDSVSVKVGVEMVAVPAVTLHSFDEAQTILTGKHLSVGHVTPQANSNVAGGIVFQQSPDSGSSVLTGAAVDLWVTPKTVQVPQVVNLLVGDALKKVQGAGLVMVLHGDQTAKLITAQTPQYPAQVAVGSTVDVTVPSSSFCVPIAKCRFAGNAVRLMVNKK